MTPPHLKTYSTSIRFPLQLRQRIADAAAAEGRRPTEWIREAVRDALARAEATPAARPSGAATEPSPTPQL